MPKTLGHTATNKFANTKKGITRSTRHFYLSTFIHITKIYASYLRAILIQ